MKSRNAKTVIALVLTALVIAPSAMMVAPRPVHAAALPVAVTADFSWPAIKTAVETTIGVIKNSITAAASVTSAAADTAMLIQQTVLDPLAFILSGNLLETITSATIAFVVGKLNSTGLPQFITDLQRSLQTVADSQALSFFKQFGSNSNSPFASSIAYALRAEYLHQSSLAGFWDAYQCSLDEVTSRTPDFLAGDWSQGGATGWMALTTADNNNPYTLYQTSQEKLQSIIGPGAGGAVGTKIKDATWGNGMTSWCGSTGSGSNSTLGKLNQMTTYSSPLNDAYEAVHAANLAEDQALADAYDDPDDPAIQERARQASAAAAAAQAKLLELGDNSTGYNPGDPCTDSNGNPGVIKTPGSIITAALNKALGGQQDQITRMGNVGPEITSILNNIATVLKTVNSATQIIGVNNSKGLLGADVGGSMPERDLSGFYSSGYMGTTNKQVYQNSIKSLPSGADLQARIMQYESAWSTIRSIANTASTSVVELTRYCNEQLAKAQDFADGKYPENVRMTESLSGFRKRVYGIKGQAQTAFDGIIADVFGRIAAADKITAEARNALAKVNDQTTAGDTESATSTYATDVAALQKMPPTAFDIGNAEQETMSFSSAEASPEGSLNITGSSLMDKLPLLSQNADTMANSCYLKLVAGSTRDD